MRFGFLCFLIGLSLFIASPLLADRNVAEAVTTPAEKAVKLGWKHESSLGATLSGGNSDTQSFIAKQTTSYSWKVDTQRTNGHYLQGRNAGVDTAKNWDLNFRYEHYLSDKIGLLGGIGTEGDSFSGYDYRDNVDLGVKYFIIGEPNKGDFFFNETGYRYQYEARVPGAPMRFLNNHFARVYFEGKYALNEAVYVRAWVEFLPNLSTTAHYMINFEPSIGVNLTKTLSLKMAFTGAYDGQPAAGKKNFDYIYTTSLVANY